ncbi:TonB-dependent receptor [Rhodoferax sp.]|uniref:TonB-dependent receptor plug domain-containing protein n=1 Tax=Rhodoferax sp. TaxID=50421 RepID=UPI002638C614|nr:TonB-dependent receptor [Rhodoferax sp.]MDD2919600.1 TonB-dependent receptor [Rhodoferax sp.]
MKNNSHAISSQFFPLLGLAWLLGASAGWAQSVTGVSENDFLAEMPIVLSVSRLPQRLDETPGAVTILDRDMIRRSGARDVPDLLRLVPGFQTSMAFEADAPQASYHGVFGLYSGRIQVLVDGRSVYSTYVVGSVAPGLMSIALEDIERIEVLRGSNSATYGARAMLGVVNIVTRNTLASLGVTAKVSQGENGIKDTRLGLGWRFENSGMRLGIDQQGDDGLSGSNGHNRVRRVNFRSDWRVSGDTEVQVRAGWMDIAAGRGFANKVDEPLRDTSYDSGFVQIDWNKVLSPEQDLALMFAHNQETYRDVAPFLPIPGLDIDSSGTARNDSLTAQHTVRLGQDVRMVWGAELRRESVTSLPLYHAPEPLVTDFGRLFAHAEWRLHPELLLNAGAMAEHSSASGSSLAPRLMLNWHVMPGQTLRAGMARSFRPPSVFETDSDIRYTVNGKVLKITFLARGDVTPETVLTRELGYYGSFSWLNSSLDVRIFDEYMSGLIQSKKYTAQVEDRFFPGVVDYVNGDNLSLRGLEFQWKGRPWPGAQLGFNQTFAKLVLPGQPTNEELPNTMPDSASSLFFSQQFSGGWSFSMSHQNSNPFRLQRSGKYKQFITRTDWRLSKPLRFGRHAGEVALTVQNQGSAQADFFESFAFERRAYVTLRLDN